MLQSYFFLLAQARLPLQAVKKLFAFLLSMLVLSLSTIPCADGPAFGQQSGSQATYSQPDPASHEHSDACSPFCICTCCAGFSANFAAPAVGIIAIYRGERPPLFNDSSTRSVALPVWQPPQLA